MKNNASLVSSIFVASENVSNDMPLTQNRYVAQTSEGLESASQNTRHIVLDLYSVSYNKLIRSAVHQIFPMAVSLDFDSAYEVVIWWDMQSELARKSFN